MDSVLQEHSSAGQKRRNKGERYYEENQINPSEKHKREID
jgi:hypothetical protein